MRLSRSAGRRVRYGLAVAVVGLLAAGQGAGQSPVAAERIERIEALKDFYERKARIERENAATLAARQAWVEQGTDARGRFFELRAIRKGVPLYVMTLNENAAVSTGANLIRDFAPYAVSGADVRVGVWDGGAVRSSHQEFGGRVSIGDSALSNNHATHVGGTIGASGVDPSARGMAPESLLESYDWNSDAAEMAARAAVSSDDPGRVRISNHSYGFISGWVEGNFSGSSGWHWFGSNHGSAREDDKFGRYSDEARSWDEICAAAPYFLPFKAAGNDRNDDLPVEGESYFYFDPFSGWMSGVFDPAVSPFADGYDKGGYDTISDTGIAKNVLTIGAVDDAVTAGARDLSRAAMTGFSGWGPADDGRVKPDLVANGVTLRSTASSGDAAYTTLSGTSMASPNAAGTAVLLQEVFRNLSGGSYLRASTLKALLIHTADDLGNPGPDYAYGWGLINAGAAADFLSAHFGKPSAQHLTVDALATGGDVKELAVRWDGTAPLRATLVWTDPPGPAVSGLDNRQAVLVNDLDLAVVGPDGTVHRPFLLDPDRPTEVAVTGDNDVDNVESVLIPSGGPPGDYRVRVSVEGGLTADGQEFSLLVEGQSGGGLSVTPSEVGVLKGPPGGPFSPSSVAFAVANADESGLIDFSVSVDVDWLDLSSTGGSVSAGEAGFELSASLNAEAALLPAGDSFGRITFVPDAGGASITRTIRLEISVDPLTQVFTVPGAPFDLEGRSLTFHPDGNGSYFVTVDEADVLPAAPGDSIPSPPDDGGIRVDPAWSGGFRLFGEPVGALFVNTNGNLTFGAADTDWEESAGDHFDQPRISALFDDFNPAVGGSISYRHSPGDRAVVTFADVPEWGTSNASTFQVELFDDGSDRIRLTYLDIAAADGIVGLSAGGGSPSGFVSSGVDFSASYTPSPVLSWTVLDGQAAEWNAAGEEARLRLENAHPFPLALDVPLVFGGAASSADDLAKLPGPVRLPAGEASVELVLTAAADDIVEGSESLLVGIGPSALGPYRLGDPSIVSVTIEDRPVDQWLIDVFGGAGVRTGDGEDFDGDGVANLVEYALGLTPTEADRADLPVPEIDEGFLFLPYVSDPARPDVKVMGESSSDLIRWETEDVTQAEDGFRTPIGDGGTYLRLRVERIVAE